MRSPGKHGGRRGQSYEDRAIANAKKIDSKSKPKGRGDLDPHGRSGSVVLDHIRSTGTGSGTGSRSFQEGNYDDESSILARHHIGSMSDAPARKYSNTTGSKWHKDSGLHADKADIVAQQKNILQNYVRLDPAS